MGACFFGSTQLKYYATYADGSKISNGAVEVNATNGEVRVRAYRKYNGRYRIKMIARDECLGETSIFFTVTINTPPKAKA